LFCIVEKLMPLVLHPRPRRIPFGRFVALPLREPTRRRAPVGAHLSAQRPPTRRDLPSRRRASAQREARRSVEPALASPSSGGDGARRGHVAADTLPGTRCPGHAARDTLPGTRCPGHAAEGTSRRLPRSLLRGTLETPRVRRKGTDVIDAPTPAHQNASW